MNLGSILVYNRRKSSNSCLICLLSSNNENCGSAGPRSGEESTGGAVVEGPAWQTPALLDPRIEISDKKPLPRNR